LKIHCNLSSFFLLGFPSGFLTKMPYAFGISPSKAHKIEAAGAGRHWLLTDSFSHLPADIQFCSK
jgi:hypothetical protein